MKRLTFLSLVVLFGCTVADAQGQSKSVFEHFVAAKGDKLMDGDTEYRFISFNIPNQHYLEDNLKFDGKNPWRLPTEFEIADTLEAVRQQGGQVVRTYTLSVRKADDPPDFPRYILGPGKFNEEAFKALDRVLKVANEKGVRIILPFCDNMSWWGGAAEYAAFHGKRKNDFYTDPEIIADYKKTIEFVINRVNTYTGVKYRDDKAIMAWETGNEMKCKQAWTHEIAGYIKSLDSNHLVIDGWFTSDLKAEQIEEPNVDIVCTHHYDRNPMLMIKAIKRSRSMVKGKKPYFVGEFGFIPTQAMRDLCDVIIQQGVSGGLTWSLRSRSRDGGFYSHSEPFGGDRYKSFHWPGFPSGDYYDETNLMKLMQQKAFEIRGLPVPPVEKPASPTLLEIKCPGAISWLGSAGATGYDIERAGSKEGPWKVVGENISDARYQNRPLFNDPTVEVGKSYCYRVKARNSAGHSAPSNVVGPVTPKVKSLVDEMDTVSLIWAYSDDLRPDRSEARKAREDIHRLKGQKGHWAIYRTDEPIASWKVFTFFAGDIEDFKFQVSVDGISWKEVEPKKEDYYFGAGGSSDIHVYGYWKPVLYHSEDVLGGAKYLKMEYRTEAQISRVEVYYGAK